MTVAKINAFFGRVGKLQIRHRFKILAVFFIVTIVCCAGLSKFRLANGSDGWYGDADKIQIDRHEPLR